MAETSRFRSWRRPFARDNAERCERCERCELLETALALATPRRPEIMSRTHTRREKPWTPLIGSRVIRDKQIVTPIENSFSTWCLFSRA